MATQSGTRYYSLPGGGTAIRTGTGSNYSFALADHHGTPSLYLNATMSTPTWRQYTPYGGARGATGTYPDNRGFLDKVVNTNTGLIQIGARSYDTDTGRFISLDPVFDGGDRQSWNGYAYANNNPASMSDPTGLRNDANEPSYKADAEQTQEDYDRQQAENSYWTSVNEYNKAVENQQKAIREQQKCQESFWCRNKSGIVGTVVGVAVGLGCGAAIAWTGAGAVACGAAAGAVGSFVTGWMDGQRGWDLAATTAVGGLFGAALGGATSIFGAGLKGAFTAAAGGRASGFANGALAEVVNIGNGLKSAITNFGGGSARNAANGGLAAAAESGKAAKLPGSAGVQIAGRLNTRQMAALSEKHGVEFALVYRAGSGTSGRGGSYWLHSGVQRSVTVPVGSDVRLIYHTHPGGTRIASDADMNLMELLGAAGSPQRSSQIVIPDGSTLRFGGKWSKWGNNGTY